MKKTATEIKDAKRISDVFAVISEESKNMALAYISALRDKEMADGSRSRESEEISQVV